MTVIKANERYEVSGFRFVNSDPVVIALLSELLTGRDWSHRQGPALTRLLEKYHMN